MAQQRGTRAAPRSTAITAKDVVTGGRFVWDVQRFLRKRTPLSTARATVQHRVQHRAENLLAVLRQAIYGQPNSPHLSLLRRVGCEYGDVERLVAAEGVEGALLALYRQGVYLTVEEYKGKRPVTRGSTTFDVRPTLLWNRVPGHSATLQTGGTRSGGIAVPLDLAAAEQQSSSHALFYEARNALHWSHGYWRVPGAASMIYLLQSCLFGVRAKRWFSPVDPASPALHPRYQWSARAMRAGSLLAGRPLPLPEFAPMSAPRPIVDWLAGELRAGRTPNLVAYPSMAVRVCEVAAEAGIDLGGPSSRSQASR